MTEFFSIQDSLPDSPATWKRSVLALSPIAGDSPGFSGILRDSLATPNDGSQVNPIRPSYPPPPDDSRIKSNSATLIRTAGNRHHFTIATLNRFGALSSAENDVFTTGSLHVDDDNIT